MTNDPATALQILYDDHASALWGFCLHLTGNDRARAEDVVQETMLRAWRHAAVLEESRGSVRSWLFTVARNVVIDEWRTRRGHREFATAEPDAGAVDDGTDELLLSWVVADALRRLSAEHRAVLVECYYRGRTVAEAARRLEIPVGTVKSRTHYALRALRLILDETGAAS
ncbi:sigma-70 family RNA polymerase sigma factor [Nocardioides ginsengisoli]|uniref:RNA polymerase sigma factor n=1 Tax=Nocardioides ginsengisoli TaxID=363868 RepID=A0ABW3VUY7_9ACTN